MMLGMMSADDDDVWFMRLDEQGKAAWQSTNQPYIHWFSYLLHGFLS
jgi:hypothetical protein